ncbi:hypothetical protein [Streptomyces apricus]|uniref:hypothetical protein n=1 Tax=Streptomyces apricus TaxID=1828112 RepID=UPI00165F7343|nr:hypothetical protein [Streptomyces apricus]
MDYAAMYRQAMADGSTDYAHSIVVSASQAAEAGALEPDELSALVEEIQANPFA